MRIGILQAGHTPPGMEADHPDYGDLFTKMLDGHGFDFAIYPVVDGTFPDGIDAADGWLITGSRHGAYDDLPWIAPLEDFIRDVYAAGTPLVGICFGHQVIAQALGGKVEKFAEGWSVGRRDYHFDGFGTLAINAWHQDQVIDAPAEARTIAGNAFCKHAALLYGDRAFTIQPHPEFGAEFIDGLIRTRGRGLVPDSLLENARAALEQPTDRAKVADMIATFFKERRLA